MVIRHYKPEDAEKIKAIHASQEYEFELPDLSASDFVSIWVAEDEGEVVSVVAARRTVEVVALVQPNYRTPAWRLETISRLQEKGALDLKRQGYSDMHCWVKSEISGFARRLQKSLGWLRSKSGVTLVRGI